MRKTFVNPNFSAFNKNLTNEEVQVRKYNISSKLNNDDLWLNDVSKELGISYNDTKKRLNLFIHMIFIDQKYYMTLPSLRKYFRNWANYKIQKKEEPSHKSTVIFDTDNDFRYIKKKERGNYFNTEMANKYESKCEESIYHDEDLFELKYHITCALYNKIKLNENIDKFCMTLLCIEDKQAIIEEFDLYAGVYLSIDELITPANFMRCLYNVLNKITSTSK